MTGETANPCATCGACCRSYIVPVSGYDVWRISTRQRLSPEQFVVAVDDGQLRQDGFLLEAEGPIYALALDKQGRRQLKQSCVFLLHLGDGHDRCGIYEHRPAVCRAYPMIHWRGAVVMRPKALCPPDTWSAAQLQPPSWIDAVRRVDLLFDLYLEVANRWNARVKSTPGQHYPLTEYLSYLLNVYDRLAGLDAELGDRRLARVQETWCNAPSADSNLAELRPLVEEYPWVDYVYRVREIVDRFYPEIPPLPLHEPVLAVGAAVPPKGSVEATVGTPAL